MGVSNGGISVRSRQVIKAITHQGSVRADHICPITLCGARRGVDPDLPASTAAFIESTFVLLVIVGYYADPPRLDTPRLIIFC